MVSNYSTGESLVYARDSLTESFGGWDRLSNSCVYDEFDLSSVNGLWSSCALSLADLDGLLVDRDTVAFSNGFYGAL
jgi:hypothetical protein